MWIILVGKLMTNWNLRNDDGSYLSLVNQMNPGIIFVTTQT